MSASKEPKIILLTSVGHCLCHIGELAFAGVIPAIMIEFAVSEQVVTRLPFYGLVLFGVGALPSGYWADRRGSYEALNGFFVALCVTCLLIFFFAKSALTFAMGLTLLGVAISIYHPVALSMLSHGCRNRGRAMGINGVAGSLGVASGPAFGLFFARYFSWQYTYLLIAILSALAFLCSILFCRDLKDIDRSPIVRTQAEKNGQPIVLLAILFCAMIVGGFNYRCVTTILPTFLSGVETQPTESEQVTDHSQEANPAAASTASLAVFLVFAMGGIGQFLGGLLGDKFRPALVYPLTIAMTIPLSFLIAHTDGIIGAMCAGTFAIFMFAEQPLENVMIAEATPSRLRSTIYGMKFILVFGIAAAGTFLAGYVWERFGIRMVFEVVAYFAMVMALLAFAYLRFSRRPRI